MTATNAPPSASVEGLAEIDGEEWYVIPDIDRMAPFLMSVVSDGDRWMFLSSTGALTAGRTDSARALFPYETDDRLHAAAGRVGPVTRLRVSSPSGEETRWDPFRDAPGPSVRRSLAKSVVGDTVVFDEHHERFGLTFRYRWASSDRFGFLRVATLVNHGDEPVRIELLDGLLNILPYGLEPVVYRRLSNLANAYKRNEVIDADTRLAVYSLESPVSDQAEPEEVLRATVAWSVGLVGADVVLDADALRAFEVDADVPVAPLLTGRPGAYLLRGAVDLAPGESASWHIVADVAHDQRAVVELRRVLGAAHDLASELDTDVRRGTDRLERIMASADALQRTADLVGCAHHFANVTSNVMRGGVPLCGYRIDTSDFAAFVADRNRTVAERHATWTASLPDAIDRSDLLERVATTGDAHLARLAVEYLPFGFSRRHGDPSRPWNMFSIRVYDDDGNPVTYYEGNWRDLFQNWEALCASFPEYLPAVISVFVNASTLDGFNPYRVTRHGIEWEVPDPDDPWSNIGYWGDHQLVYLLRLLEAADRYRPGEVTARLGERSCTYADVPYRLAPYDELLRDPKSTIEFDAAADARAGERVAAIGGDGKLLLAADGEPVMVTLLEKLLVTVLAKLSNFVPGGGIWMNTQRPEWNDANNALVGYGLSMVTLYHLREFLDRLRALVSARSEVAVSSEIVDWLHTVLAVLADEGTRPSDDPGHHRKRMMDRLGTAYSDHRERVYCSGLSGDTTTVTGELVQRLCEVAIDHLDVTSADGRRPDGLFHSYNLIRFTDDETASIEHLPEMLEGQVAVLGSGVLTAEEQAELVETLFASDLYRPDQDSFLLYPVRHLPAFVDKNVVPADDVATNPLLSGLLAAGEPSVVRTDADGVHRFHSDLTDEPRLTAALDALAEDDQWRDLVAEHREATLSTYERVFRHRSYTGRSGSMYAYEGIGSVYWHMVTKLLVAIQHSTFAAADGGASAAMLGRLVDDYGRVHRGLGHNKTPAEFGAFPTDPYSHTPAHAGAQQPGMTGTVKEEILIRPAELGVRVVDGEIAFDTMFLRRSELLDRESSWTVVDLDGRRRELVLEPDTLGLTLCQVPIVVGLTTDDPGTEVEFADGRTVRRAGRRLGREISEMVFGRTGDVTLIRAALPHEPEHARSDTATGRPVR